MLDFWQQYPEIHTKLTNVQQMITQRLVVSNKEIQDALDKFIAKGGKMVRPALFFLFSELSTVSPDEEKIVKIAASIELLHAATLVHDDIIDDSPLRRSLPSLQAQFGKDVAVYTGDFIYTVYFELLTETMAHTPFLLKNTRAMRKILQGELDQMSLTYRQNQTIKDYLRSINGKTAELIGLSCSEGAYFGGSDKQTQARAKRIGQAIGLAFQIYDDILNFTVTADTADKPILTDVAQGIFTLPLLIARDKAPAVILPYMAKPETLSKQELLTLAKLVEETGGLTEAYQTAQYFSEKALAEIQKLPDGKNKLILAEITRQLLYRSY